ncbi:MAG: hypothetical protein GX823_02285 [Clostridiales bacterium]|nr:hypothetical protein [Clostridiales bacterium]
MVIENNKGGEYAKNYVQELMVPPGMMSPEMQELYDKFAKRILWIDGDICPGAFQMNTAWYKGIPEKDPMFPEHVHAQSELVGFFGSNPDDPYDLGGIIEFAINGENHRLTRSTITFIPGGIKHGPLRIVQVDRPIFHFSAVMTAQYDAEAIYK